MRTGLKDPREDFSINEVLQSGCYSDMKGHARKGLPECKLEYLNGIYWLIEDRPRPKSIIFDDVIQIYFIFGTVICLYYRTR